MSIEIKGFFKDPIISESNKRATRKKYAKHSDIFLALAAAKKLNKNLKLIKSTTPEIEEEKGLITGKDKTIEEIYKGPEDTVEKKHSKTQQNDPNWTFENDIPIQSNKTIPQEHLLSFQRMITPIRSNKTNLDVKVKKTRKNTRNKDFIRLNKKKVKEISEKNKNRKNKSKNKTLKRKNKSKKIFLVRNIARL